MLVCGLHAQILFHNDFEHLPLGNYDYDQFKIDWHNPEWQTGITHGRVSIGIRGQTKVLEVLYPAGKYGSFSNTSGAQWPMRLEQSYEELYLQYWFKFDAGFEWVLGGKLPGLIGGRDSSGGVVAGGYLPDGTDGWSARFMWHKEGKIFAYLYYPDMPDQFGHNIFLQNPDGSDFVLQPNVWYQLTQRVKMNTPGERDGILQAWLNGQMVLDKQDIRYRDVSSLEIDGLYFSTFYGGNTPEWAPQHDNRAFFDDFLISTAPFNGLEQASGIQLQINPIEDVAVFTQEEATALVTVQGAANVNFVLRDAPEFVRIFPGDGQDATILVEPGEYDAGRYEIRVEANLRGISSTTTLHLQVLEEDASGAAYRINAGADADTILHGVKWSRDQYYSGNTSANVSTGNIEATRYDAIYLSERLGDNFTYHFPLPEGNYDVVLHFAEIDYTSPGSRVQNIIVEDSAYTLQHYDIYAAAGGYRAEAKIVRDIAVSDGGMDIELASLRGGAQISAIEIFRQLPSNFKPAFSLSGDVALNEGFTNEKTVYVFPWDPALGEEEQIIQYEIKPTTVDFATMSFNPGTGQVDFSVLPGKSGSQTFTITADDGFPFNNAYTRSFNLVVLPCERAEFVNTSALRINAGGCDITGVDTSSEAITYWADQDFSTNTQTWTVPGAIAGTQLENLYRTERYGNAFSYEFPLPNGAYKVILHFAENTWSGTGVRVFDVFIENNQVLKDFDIFAEVGMNHALTKTFDPIQVEDEMLDIYFQSSADMAKVSAIEVIGKEMSVNNWPASQPDEEVKLFPQPIYGGQAFNLQYVSSDGNITHLQLLNSLGQIMWHTSLRSRPGVNQVKVATSNLAGGMYYLCIQNGQQLLTKKVLVE